MTSAMEYAIGVSQNWVATALALIAAAAIQSLNKIQWKNPANAEDKRQPMNVKNLFLLCVVSFFMMAGLLGYSVFKFYGQVVSESPITRFDIADFCFLTVMIVFSARGTFSTGKQIVDFVGKLSEPHR